MSGRGQASIRARPRPATNAFDHDQSQHIPAGYEDCHVEELALPTHTIQLLGEGLSTDEAASVELREAEAVHQTHSLCRLFKAAPTTPCICRELHSLRQVFVMNV